jgi:hypothetical protein
MDTIPFDLFGVVCEFSGPRGVLLLMRLSKRLKDFAIEFHGESICELEMILKPIVCKISDDDLFVFLCSSINIPLRTGLFREFTRRVCECEFGMLRLVICLHKSRRNKVAGQFLEEIKILGPAYEKFFSDIVHGKDFSELIRSELFSGVANCGLINRSKTICTSAHREEFTKTMLSSVKASMTSRSDRPYLIAFRAALPLSLLVRIKPYDLAKDDCDENVTKLGEAFTWLLFESDFSTTINSRIFDKNKLCSFFEMILKMYAVLARSVN